MNFFHNEKLGMYDQRRYAMLAKLVYIFFSFQNNIPIEFVIIEIFECKTYLLVNPCVLF